MSEELRWSCVDLALRSCVDRSLIWSRCLSRTDLFIRRSRRITHSTASNCRARQNQK